MVDINKKPVRRFRSQKGIVHWSKYPYEKTICGVSTSVLSYTRHRIGVCSRCKRIAEGRTLLPTGTL